MTLILTKSEEVQDQILELDLEGTEEVVNYAIRSYVGGLAGDVAKEVTHDKLLEYIAESNHNSWDGWEPEQLMGAAGFFRDLLLYVRNS